ncbi:MAG: hypothetical protein KGH78_03290, partial [Candidatus Micrarchaeota archaeon]|nr:hypothetical protein [Candidatus Micrarchaeota archaeon]
MDGQENTAGAPTVGMPPQGAPQGQPSSTGKKPKIRDPLEQLRSRQQLGAAIVPILVVIIIVVGIIGVLSVLLTHKAVATTTISHVTTTAGQTMQQIQNCMTITKPGEYFLGKPLNVVLSSGACISVKSSNVKLVGNQNKITGSGPFVGTPPYTYGIYIGKVS